MPGRNVVGGKVMFQQAHPPLLAFVLFLEASFAYERSGAHLLLVPIPCCLVPPRQDGQAEIRDVANLQAQAFFEATPFAPINAILRTSFQAEVYAVLRNKMQHGQRDSFSCLVAEAPKSCPGILGACELSLQNDKDVLEAVGGEEAGYAYIACMAVAPSMRRQGIASSLLAAAEAIAAGPTWRMPGTVLHVYKDNAAGIGLYEACGYEVVGQDPQWHLLVGGRPRLLMAKAF